MAQQQHADDVHPDELCSPNKRHDLMDANKKVDLEHVQCPSETWQTLCKISSSACLHALRIGNQPPLQILCKMLYCFVNNFCGLCGRARDAYHNLQDDDIMKNIFNSGRNKNKVGMRIPAWMITDSPNPATETAESSVPKRSTVIRFRLPSRQSARLTPPVPVPSAEKADEMILQDMIQVSLAEHKSREEQEARENVALGQYGYLFAHLKKRFMPRSSSDQLADNLHDVMMETLPSLVKEKVTEQVKKEVSYAQVRDQSSCRTWAGGCRPKISSQIQNAIDNAIPSLVDASADPLLQQQDIAIWLALQMKFEKIQVPQTACRSSKGIAQEIRTFLWMMLILWGVREYVQKKAEYFEYEAYVYGESSSGQVNVEETGPSTLGNQEQDDEFDFWTDSYASDDDEIPTNQVTQDIMEEISLTIDEAKLKKMADEMLWTKRCLQTSRWVNKCIKKFNPYARYGVENWKNPHAKIFYIRRQKEPGRPKEEIYSNSKIVQVIKTFWELGHEHKFITEIVARRANDSIVSITEPDYKELNKKEHWKTLFIRSSVIWERVHDFQLGIESYQQKINLTAPTITFPGIEEYDVFSIIYEPYNGIFTTNTQRKERREKGDETFRDT
ncbi:hypothetical protein Tco_0983681 [Tanacetum coccineum]